MDVILGSTEAQPARGREDNNASRGVLQGVPVYQALRPLTPLLAAAAFAVTAMTLVGCLIVA
jgi:hypothetical protein